jgi:acyl transferase domain-containing protein/acyl carrier protein
LKRALLAIERLQAKLDAVERARSEPIAIVGIGCRLPGGVETAEGFWELLAGGVDAVSEVPPERWDINAYYDPNTDAPGKMNTRWGGFLSGIEQFDPLFFGISPREAATLDPQQRLILEVAWEALENAGHAPDRLRGTATGVYIGVLGSDYGDMQLADNGVERIDAYFGSGTARSMVSGRLSYTLGLQGPSISIDTACSSSLVALHLACQSLRSGETNLAIVGGVNLTLQPNPTIALSRFHMMAPDGRCKTFDQRADGFVRSEACCVVVLKPLSAALAAGDRIHAQIRGSAINQDGASSGLTAPNGPAQEAVIRAALKNAQLSSADVTYIETHGTGTALGDPIEVQAIARVLGDDRANAPVYLGAVKANVGHAEAAAGLVGLIKMILCLQHRQLPGQLHLQDPNPMIPWEDLAVCVPRSLTPWPQARPLIGGVSSFGFSGTNVHVLMEAAPSPVIDPPRSGEDGVDVLMLSAASEPALRATASRYAAWLNSSASRFSDVCFTVNTGRMQRRHRLSLLASRSDEAAERLAAYADGGIAPELEVSQLSADDQPPVAFLFTGQGSQYGGMGLSLYGRDPAFTRQLDYCDRLFAMDTGRSLIKTLADDRLAQADTAVAQPAIFALESALAAMWRAWGVEPSAVMGHSLGEYVAAHVAGVLSLEDAVRLVATRARLMSALPHNGRMTSIFAEETLVLDAVAEHAAEVSIAAFNAPGQMVISGSAGGVERVLNRLGPAVSDTRELAVSHAFHSPLMDPMLDEFERTASEVRFAEPRIRLVSNLTGTVARQGVVSSAAYWRQHLRSPVRFAAGIAELKRLEIKLFLELGPAPVLCALGPRSASDGRFIPSLRQGQPEWTQVMRSAAALYRSGVRPDWRRVADEKSRAIVSAPTSVFERRRCWFEQWPRTPVRGVPRRRLDWLYEIQWSLRELPTSDKAVAARWLICANSLPAARALAQSCALRGIQTLLVGRNAADRPEKGRESLLAQGGPAAVSALLHSCQVSEFNPTGVLFVAAEPGQAKQIDLIVEDGIAAGDWLRALSENATKLPIWLITRGACPIARRSPVSPEHAGLAGWGRVAALEYPQTLAGVVDLDPDDAQHAADALAATLAGHGGEEQIAWRGRQSFVPRVRRVTADVKAEMQWHDDRCYLVTGWMGGLGLHLVRWLADRGVCNLILVGRRTFSANDASMADAARVVSEIEARGVSVVHAQMDVDDSQSLKPLFARFGKDLPVLAGVFHLAATLTDGAIESLDAKSFRRMVAPKVGGAWILHELTRNLALDCFVLFSSTTAVLGTKKLAHYAAASAALDALAQLRNAAGLTALSINWGSWDEMRLVTEQDRKLFRRSGMLPMRVSDALALLEYGLGLRLHQVMIADIDWRTLKSVYQARRERNLFCEMADAPDSAADAPEIPGAEQSAAVERWQFDHVPPQHRGDVLAEYIRAEVARIIGLDSSELDESRGLFEMGMDSLMAVELRHMLGNRLGRELPVTLTFNYPNVAALTQYLLGVQFPDVARSAVDEAEAVGQGDSSDDDDLIRRLQQKLREVQT